MTDAASHGPPPRSRSQHGWKDYLRLAGAFVLIPAAIGAVILLDSFQWARVCHEATAGLGSAPIVVVCEPPTSDPLIAGLMGLIVLGVVLSLAAPFISELGFLGVSAKLREEVNENRTRMDRLTLRHAPSVA